jgi:hypothetical protein
MRPPQSPEQRESFETFCYDSDSDAKMSDLDLGGDDDYDGGCPLPQEPESYPGGEDVAWELTSDSGWASGYMSPVNEGAGLLRRGIKRSRPRDDLPPKKRRKYAFDGVLIPRITHSDTNRSSISPSPTAELEVDNSVDGDYVNSSGSSDDEYDGSDSADSGVSHLQKHITNHSMSSDGEGDDDGVHRTNKGFANRSMSSPGDDGEFAESGTSHIRTADMRDRQEEEESTDEESETVGKGGGCAQERGTDKATEHSDNAQDDRHHNFQTPPPSPFLVTADVRKRLNPRLTHVREGEFAWKDGRHRCDHEAGRNIPEDAPVNSSCALLSFISGMYFCPLLGSVLCPTHRCIVPYLDIPHHMTLHKVALRYSSLTPQQVQSHVHDEFGISETQDMASITEAISSLQLSSPIPGLPLPDLCMQCPNCKGWLISQDGHPRKGLYNHWNRNQPCTVWYQSQSPPPDQGTFPRRYAVALFHGHSTVKAHRAVFVDDYRPSDKAPDALPASTTPRSHFAYYMPEYLKDFGWSPYVEGLKADRATLMQLVAMPSDRIANTWPEGSEGRNIEQGLQVVDAFYRNYLYDANYLVNQCNNAVRRAITAG